MNSSQAKFLSAGVLVILVLTPIPAQGLAETVELQHKLTPGDTLTYAYALSAIDRYWVLRINTHDERQIDGQLIMNVKSVSDGGTVTLEIVRRLRITEQGRSEDTPTVPIEVQLRPTGEILKPAKGRMTYFPVRLPDHPVAFDESWTYGEFAGISGIAGFLVVPRTLTLIGVERIGEQRVARIQVRGEGRPVEIDYTLPTGAEHVRIRLRGTPRLAGEILWLVDQGRMQRFREEASLEAPLEVEVRGLSSTGGFVFKSVEQADSVPSKN